MKAKLYQGSAPVGNLKKDAIREVLEGIIFMVVFVATIVIILAV